MYKSLFTEKREQYNTSININKTKAATKSVMSKWLEKLKIKEKVTWLSEKAHKFNDGAHRFVTV